ncbi:Sterol desaturase/sphingolipid hydroxylase, fatty acid hydroxylase superfamily [Epilithonimonas bovis DSM 19482]|jgi:sterol desaturase/sphingolipid hydroxylase (fatty acid hydroxylase superfamily)|uniref:Sterol desaturase/sphingolipid hydroxylase, fatty acid hydroxylase superfamily n=1 Tax=Epilithonimonas bovis DSM 19482 TaxID=1121284 RepID=A0A1U7PVX5_9FLAO|nr:sterol desaturase family protein [Epilithonimonas bovis]MDN5627202.1 sterol desaturase family protein [Weeksellaceae bacterium]QIY82862.1 sterol desaturase family protein [Chryseobacterium sp. NEB161]SIT95971.1 Sterol desaturase/sphingolipid hydroxylase, fatty acid hydroxylase superfamily [Epilithonimonas bovis DSM 19482]HBR11052.1 sterol desaturase family protein [Chryseobacterium sp.]
MKEIFSENGQGIIYMWSIPVHTVVILGEMLYSHFNKEKLYETRDVLSNIYLAILNYGLDLLMKGVSMAVMFFFYHHRIFTWEFNIWYFVAVFILQDFVYYVLHYVDHHSRAFWAVHITHHSSDHFNITTGFRSPVLQPLYRYLYFSPLAFLGFNPWHIMVAYSVLQVYGTWVHTQTVKSMGFLEWFMVTPSHHRVHHACNIRYLDRNMGMALIIWDRIFGTFEKEVPDVPIKYGIYPKMEDKGPVNLVFYEWKKIAKDLRQPGLSIRDRIMYLFYAPGWRHDGSGKTVKDYQKEELQRRLNKQNK